MTTPRRRRNPAWPVSPADAEDFSKLSPTVLAARVSEREPPVLAWVAQQVTDAEGNAARAARSLGISRVTLWRWRERHPEIRAALAHARVDAAAG